MIGDMNDGARQVTVAMHVSEMVARQRARIEEFYGDGNPDTSRLALLARDMGDLADAFLYGTDNLYERVAVIAAGAEEWMLSMQREAAR